MLSRETRKRSASSATTSHCSCCNPDRQVTSSEVKQRTSNMDQDTTENFMDSQFDTDICDNPSTSNTATNLGSELPSNYNILDLNLVSDISTHSVPGARTKLVKNKTASKNSKTKKGKQTVSTAPAATLLVQSLPKTITSAIQFPT